MASFAEHEYQEVESATQREDVAELYGMQQQWKQVHENIAAQLEKSNEIHLRCKLVSVFNMHGISQ